MQSPRPVSLLALLVMIALLEVNLCGYGLALRDHQTMQLFSTEDTITSSVINNITSNKSKPFNISTNNNFSVTTKPALTRAELNSMQASISAEETWEDRLQILISIMVNSLIFVVGMVGNLIVILVIMNYTKTETVTDIYILNLAFADLMFIFGLVFLVTTMFLGHWIFGNIMCKLYMATTSLNQFASSLLLVVMSFDRFLAVCHPIYAQRFRQPRRATAICLCFWIICLILMTPILMFAKKNEHDTCAIFWPDIGEFNCDKAFTLYSFAIGFAVPLLLIAVFYLCVIRKLRMAANVTSLKYSRRRSRSRGNASRRIEFLVIGIICTYTICWLPYWMMQLCVSFCQPDHQFPDFYQKILVATSLSYTNSALNPILYAFLSDNFKRRCTDIINSIKSSKFLSITCSNCFPCCWLCIRRIGTSSHNDRAENQQHQYQLASINQGSEHNLAKSNLCSDRRALNLQPISTQANATVYCELETADLGSTCLYPRPREPSVFIDTFGSLGHQETGKATSNENHRLESEMSVEIASLSRQTDKQDPKLAYDECIPANKQLEPGDFPLQRQNSNRSPRRERVGSNEDGGTKG